MTVNSQPILQAHCQSPSSPRTDQSFAKELAKPTQDKILFKKNYASPQVAHLALPDTQANPSQSQKSHFLANPDNEVNE